MLSYMRTFGLVLAATMLIGVSGGALLSAALVTGMRTLPTRAGLGVSSVAFAMSISQALLVQTQNAYKRGRGVAVCPKEAPGIATCWPELMRLTAVLVATTGLVGCLLVNHLHIPAAASDDNDGGDGDVDAEKAVAAVIVSSSNSSGDYAGDGGVVADGGEHNIGTSEDHELGVLDSLKVLRHPYFLLLSFSFMLGVASGTFILSSLEQMWHAYAGKGHHEAWVG
jgi:hypothetical protein